MADINKIITDNIDVWTSAIKKRNSQGRGSSKKIELTGIKKLRELIIDLAVRGKLVPQDSNDEPASRLLANVNSYLCEKLGKKELPKFKRDKSVVEPSEFHRKLPENWEWCELQDIVTFLNGKAHEQFISEDPSYVLINSKFVSNSGKIRKYATERLTPLDQGDIAMVMSDVPNGKALARCYLVEKDELYTLNQRICGLTTSPHIDREYLIIALDRNKYLLGYNDGQKQTNLKKIQVMSCPISIPPLDEQNRIVAKVDELMALCDQLEQQTEQSLTAHQTLVEVLLAALFKQAEGSSDSTEDFQTSWQRIAEHFDLLFTTELSIEQLKQTILQLAVMGKLVPQNPSDEPASVLLEKIAEEKAQLIADKKIKKQKPLPAITDEEKPFEVPEGWEWCRLEGTALTSEAGWSPSCLPTARENNKWGVLKISAVTWGVFNPNENKELPSGLEPRPQYEVQTGDFLISRANTAELVARAVIVPLDAPKKLMMSDKIIRFVLSPRVEGSFISLVNNSRFSRAYYAEVAGGTSSSMKNVSREQIRSLVVALPPLAEQHRIVAKVDELMALCEQLKARLSDAQTTQLHLADAVVENALGDAL
jgi:type I restriction enzyme S subunit